MKSRSEISDELMHFFNEMDEDLKVGLMPIQVFNNQEIYDLELRRIFARSWVYIGHESELPNNGDFATRYIGEDPFIFTRDQKGKIQVLLNSCRHRGAQVCRADMGNTTRFVCPYHGWTYKCTGELLGVPAKTQGYRNLETSEWGLLSAPHVVSYHGLVFANLDKDAIPFEEYIGAYKWYFDIQFLLSEGGMEVVGEPHRWLVDANWKQGAENFCGDSSHTQMTHRSAVEIGIVGEAAAGAPGKNYGLHVHECDGHSISIRQNPDGGDLFWYYPKEVTDYFKPGALNEAQFDLARKSMVHNGTIFPNFSYLHIGMTNSLEKDPAGFLTLRVWQPKGPGKMEIWSWILVPKEASESYRRRAYQVGMSSFSPSGSFEQDDVVAWSGIARSAKTVFAEMSEMKLNYTMGLGDNGDVEPIKDWPGPGVAVPSNAGEGGLRTFHRTWYDKMMDADSGSVIKE